MFENVLAEQNPHWTGAIYPQIIERECFSEILRYLQVPQVISITGVRRAGKSTLLKRTINYLMEEEKIPPTNLLFANLEHPYFSQYSEDVQYLERLFEDYLKIANPRGKIFCFLDEIQFFAKWPIFVKAHYEQKGVKFIVTGSNSFLMSHDLLTLLSGRTLPVEVYPLSFGELIRAKTEIKEFTPLATAQHRHEIRRLLDHFLRFGGFPEVVLLAEESLADDILNAYAKTILYQDVASRLNLKKPLDLERLFYYLSSHIGSSFFYAGLAELFDLTDKTIKDYIKALIDANLLFEIDKFSFSIKQQIRAPKKIYAIDTGMINAIAFKFSENRGKLFENVLYLELKRRKKEIYYYKTSGGYEIDFLIKTKEGLELIQVCIDLHEKAEMREVRALVHAAKELGLDQGILITAEIEKQWVIDAITITAIPLYQFITKLSR
jgi:uncharacterized protein